MMQHQPAPRFAVDVDLPQIDQHDFMPWRKLLFQHVELAQIDRHRQHADDPASLPRRPFSIGTENATFKCPVDVLRYTADRCGDVDRLAGSSCSPAKSVALAVEVVAVRIILAAAGVAARAAGHLNAAHIVDEPAVGRRLAVVVGLARAEPVLQAASTAVSSFGDR